MPVDDLSILAADLQSEARPDGNEVSWHISRAPAVIEALAKEGRKVLGLDIRDYYADGTFIEVPWSVYNGSDVRAARNHALEALSHGDLPGEWVLITW